MLAATYAAPAWVTVTVMPLRVRVPVRVSPELASKAKTTLALPVPETLPARCSQEALAVFVQLGNAGTVTEMTLSPPA